MTRRRRAGFAAYLSFGMGIGCASTSAPPGAPAGADAGADAGSGTGADGGPFDAGSPIPPCGDAGPTFTTLPIAANEFYAFRALGFMSPPIHVFPAKHSAFTINIPDSGVAYRSIYFPGPAWVREITATKQTSFDGGAIDGGTGFQLTFYPCAEYRSYFNHIGVISESLRAAFDDGGKSCVTIFPGDGYGMEKCTNTSLMVPVDAGEFVGISDGYAGVDFGAIDYRLPPAPFINLSHYDGTYPYYTSPALSFAEPVKSQLLARIGSVDGTKIRTAPPVVGTHMQDIAGTAQGNWFFPGTYVSTNGEVNNAIALVHDMVDPTQPIFSIGNALAGVSQGLATFPVEATGQTNRDFNLVRPDGGVFCYERFVSGQTDGGQNVGWSGAAVLLVTMPSDSTLRVERVAVDAGLCSSVPLWAFTDAGTTYER
ncbi:MAG: hypothetical protein HYY84_08430 [Deltaproteobacteria bacterium]|nr:hypothetical protein [Deltaproteobacteria bacterium]